MTAPLFQFTREDWSQAWRDIRSADTLGQDGEVLKRWGTYWCESDRPAGFLVALCAARYPSWARSRPGALDRFSLNGLDSRRIDTANG